MKYLYKQIPRNPLFLSIFIISGFKSRKGELCSNCFGKITVFSGDFMGIGVCCFFISDKFFFDDICWPNKIFFSEGDWFIILLNKSVIFKKQFLDKTHKKLT